MRNRFYPFHIIGAAVMKTTKKLLNFQISFPEYRDIINTRVIGFTFLNDIIRFPQDPYGQFGPSLNDILNGKEK